SDTRLVLNNSLSLPIFNVEGADLYRRLTLVLMESRIIKVFYPISRPDKNADEVVHWLKVN
ncbi:MAG: peroxiredoxin, partial [Gammaproteobacteria bacterium]|nr:peroxiredoxin [Gammaproteobacteria bacterium]